jgi:hypothetical protein
VKVGVADAHACQMNSVAVAVGKTGIDVSVGRTTVAAVVDTGGTVTNGGSGSGVLVTFGSSVI